MMEASPSPRVPTESISDPLPVFRPKKSFFSRTAISSPYNFTKATKEYHSAFFPTQIDDSPCSCPHVLASDDDNFQEFYYRNLFKKSLNFNELAVEEKDFKFDILKSGEELLDKYNKTKACSCELPLLIMTDYDMGEDKLNGVETILELRKEGFKGSAILRTSEDKDSLAERHTNFEELLESKKIDFYLEKGTHLKTKEVLNFALKREQSPSKNTIYKNSIKGLKQDKTKHKKNYLYK